MLGGRESCSPTFWNGLPFFNSTCTESISVLGSLSKLHGPAKEIALGGGQSRGWLGLKLEVITRRQSARSAKGLCSMLRSLADVFFQPIAIALNSRRYPRLSPLSHSLLSSTLSLLSSTLAAILDSCHCPWLSSLSCSPLSLTLSVDLDPCCYPQPRHFSLTIATIILNPCCHVASFWFATVLNPWHHNSQPFPATGLNSH